MNRTVDPAGFVFWTFVSLCVYWVTDRTDPALLTLTCGLGFLCLCDVVRRAMKQ
jgi:hypothetical protein